MSLPQSLSAVLLQPESQVNFQKTVLTILPQSHSLCNFPIGIHTPR